MYQSNIIEDAEIALLPLRALVIATPVSLAMWVLLAGLAILLF